MSPLPDCGRSPYGERGLKYRATVGFGLEIRRSPYGERGLKCEDGGGDFGEIGRSPYGERGLKFYKTWAKCGHGIVALLTESVD